MSCKTTTFWSYKGGVGKTFIAVNTATALALARHRVLLLELNFQSVHTIDKMLNVQCRYALANLISQLETSDNPEIIRKAVVTHSSGLEYLPTISASTQGSRFTPELLKAFFKKATQLYEYIIIDSQRTLNEGLVSVMHNSNLISMVATPDDLSIDKLRLSVGMLNSINVPNDMIKLVINRAASRGGMDLEELKNKVNLNIIGKIPSDGKTVVLALNNSVPCVIESPKTQVSQALQSLAKELERTDIYSEIQIKEKVKITTSMDSNTEVFANLGRSQPAKDDAIEFDQDDAEIAYKLKVHAKLMKILNIENMGPDALADVEFMNDLKDKANKAIDKILIQEDPEMADKEDERKRITKELISEAFGLGALEEFLEDPDISDIMVNSQKKIFVEKGGKILRTNGKFMSEQQMRSIIDRIIAPIGRRVDESTPMVDARLQDGSRFNALIPPLSLTGPMITIRKFGRERPTIEDMLTKYHSLNDDMSKFLEACVIGRKNIIVSGGTGSGKTTLLNIVSTFIPNKERIVTIEDAAELRINKQHWIRLESRPPNLEGKGAVPIRTLFMNSLHMRPDRIIVGECRGSEVIDMLQAMNTGHDGSMTTLHANSTKDVLVRMSSMMLLSGVDLPMRAIHEMISTALDMIVHVNRFADGTRKIVEVTEVTGLTDEHYLKLEDVFLYDQKGLDENGKITGDYTATGYIPKCFEEFKTIGIPISEEMFKPKK